MAADQARDIKCGVHLVPPLSLTTRSSTDTHRQALCSSVHTQAILTAFHAPVFAGILMEPACFAQEAGELLRARHSSQALQQGSYVLRNTSLIAHGLRAQAGRGCEMSAGCCWCCCKTANVLAARTCVRACVCAPEHTCQSGCCCCCCCCWGGREIVLWFQVVLGKKRGAGSLPSHEQRGTARQTFCVLFAAVFCTLLSLWWCDRQFWRGTAAVARIRHSATQPHHHLPQPPPPQNGLNTPSEMQCCCVQWCTPTSPCCDPFHANQVQAHTERTHLVRMRCSS